MRLYRRQKRGTGERVWWASWTENGRTIRRSTRCTTKAAAELVARRWELERVDPRYAAENKATLGGEAVMFLRESEGHIAPATLQMYRQKAGNLIGVIGRETRLIDIDANTVANYVAFRRNEGAAESTIYKEWVTLRMVLKSARHRGAFNRDPAALKPPRFGPRYKPRERFLTWVDIPLLLAELPPKKRACVLFVICTGARRAELERAKVLDVRADVVHLRGSKTEAANRIIPIPPPFWDLWSELRESLEGEDDDAPIMPKWHSARRDIIRACQRAAIEPVTWNDLRRTFASLLVQAGLAPHIVARLLGHKSTAMIDRVYGRTDLASLTRLVEGVRRVPTVNQVRDRRRESGGQ